MIKSLFNDYCKVNSIGRWGKILVTIAGFAYAFRQGYEVARRCLYMNETSSNINPIVHCGTVINSLAWLSVAIKEHDSDKD